MQKINLFNKKIKSEGLKDTAKLNKNERKIILEVANNLSITAEELSKILSISEYKEMDKKGREKNEGKKEKDKK